MSSTREHLLGYLLDALEPSEQEAVERDLESQPELRRQLAALEASLHPLGFPDREDGFDLDGPPRNLAERALDFVDDTRRELEIRESPGKLSPAATGELAAEVRRVSWADFVVAASVLLAAGALLFPAIASSRQSAQVTMCQNNLRQVGQSLEEFSNRAPDHCIPAVPLRGNRAVAGIYSALLKDAALLPYEEILVCPASDLANRTTAQQPFSVPSLAHIDQAVGETLHVIQRSLGGSYGYNLGFVENGKHRAPQMQGRTQYAVMSDAPSHFDSARYSKNHSGRGQNMLYADNHVRFVVDLANDLLDDPYRNRSGIIAAGEDADDIVLGNSIARPMPSFMQTAD